MRIIGKDCRLASKWYTKPTDTGLVMNFRALAPLKYKRTVVTGIVNRIFRSCSSWIYFHQGLSIAKQILLDNQYPESFYEPLILKTLQKLLIHENSDDTTDSEEEALMYRVFLRCREKITED